MILTDGGRAAEGFTNEKLDCTVRAVALTRRMSYKAAHELMEAAGRKAGHRFEFAAFMEGQGWARLVAAKGTIRRFVKEHPEGNYIVRIRGHVFALCGGIALDLWPIADKLNRITHVWEVSL